MTNVAWLIRRLKAMSIPEVLWRLSQINVQKQEEKQYGKEATCVTSTVFNSDLSNLQFHSDNLYINTDNKQYGFNRSIHLLAGADYKDYRMHWNAGFQTNNVWPDTFSPKLEYKQRDEIGDARTNWELNRHFQFALLAKGYYASNDKKYLDEFCELFEDWNTKNPFLRGISWTSVMEIAIRCSNWCYAYVFLDKSGVDKEILDKLRIGIINMTDYILKHYSRYSSANNHLIVEAYAVGQSGILFEHKKWVDLSLKILTKQLTLQNYSDGINKELSLHYQTFYMEAMGLMMRLLLKNRKSVPDNWKPMLTKMSRFTSDCIGDCGEVIVFGDDDEGKILDLQGGKTDYYTYVLGMMSILLDERYTTNYNCETLHWLFTSSELDCTNKKNEHVSSLCCSYKEGGNTILRSDDHEMLLGIDHAALGFGSIAAHGHADALSFQLFYKGKPVFIDPGTYIYHCSLESRNEFRKTKNHNTVCIADKDQSEMLGAFLWGKKANSELVTCECKAEATKIVMKHDGYSPIMHERTIDFDGHKSLRVYDSLSESSDAISTFIFADDIRPEIDGGKIKLYRGQDIIVAFSSDSGIPKLSEFDISYEYGIKKRTYGITIPFTTECAVEISLM